MFKRSFHAADEEFRTEFKVPPFQDCVLSFLGFSDEEKANMEERTLKHGERRWFVLFILPVGRTITRSSVFQEVATWRWGTSSVHTWW